MINSILSGKIQSHSFTKWMLYKKWKYFDYQLKVLNVSSKHNNILISSPTGTGKTIAAFLPSIFDITKNSYNAKLHTVYISPLKSLAKDIKRSISIPINQMKMNISLDIRTGDTSSYNKNKIKKKPPNILITTPESFALMMSYENSESYFSDLRFLIIDELHNLIHTKRGDLLSLNMTRVSSFSTEIKKIGISATIKNKKEALNYLSNNNKGIIIESNVKKHPSIKILKTDKEIPWSGHMANYAVGKIYEKISLFTSTIVFVNTRAQAEFLFQKIWLINELGLKIGLHHGSLDNVIRDRIEKDMFHGKLNCIIATSSLELGIDWGAIDLIIQVGAPKGVNRILQRVGRSNHKFRTPSKAYLVPTNKFEYIECLAAINNIKSGKIEDRIYKTGSLDVLAQHILGVACSSPFNKDELFDNIRCAFPYKNLERKQFEKIIKFIENGGYALRNYDAYAKIKKYEKDFYKITNKKFIQRYRMNIGTIVDEPMVTLFLKNKKLGKIESYFINKLIVGDTFLFAGEVLEYEKEIFKGIQVRKTLSSNPKIPSYIGGRLPLSSELADEVLNILRGYRIQKLPENIKNWIKLQSVKSRLPPKSGLLIETFSRKIKEVYNYYLVAYTFQGRNVNQTIGMLLLKELQENGYKPIAFVATDYAIAIWSIEEYQKVPSIFNYKNINKNFYEWLDKTSLVKRHFRNIATISGLIDSRLPGFNKSGKQVTFNSDLIFDVLYKYEKEHILLETTKLEALNELVDYKRLSNFLKKIQNNIIHKKLKYISPMAVPLILEFNTEKIEKNHLIKYELDNTEDNILREADLKNENLI